MRDEEPDDDAPALAMPEAMPLQTDRFMDEMREERAQPGTHEHLAPKGDYGDLDDPEFSGRWPEP